MFMWRWLDTSGMATAYGIVEALTCLKRHVLPTIETPSNSASLLWYEPYS